MNHDDHGEKHGRHAVIMARSSRGGQPGLAKALSFFQILPIQDLKDWVVIEN